MQRLALALVSLLLCGAAPLVAEDPVLTGVVTDAGTPANFQVDGYRVLCTPNQTLSQHGTATVASGSRECPQHHLGETVLVDGVLSEKKRLVAADRVRVITPVDVRVEGSALVDKLLHADKQGATVRADGYVLQLTASSRITYESTLTPGLEHITTNQWIEYRGLLHPNGTVRVDAAEIGPNVISDAEDKLRSKQEFDPAAVAEGDRQNGVGEFFFGQDRTRIPAYSDPDMQARVDAVGQRLIPEYQRALPASDPSKIDFRFQLVDESRYAFYSLASGIILVSKNVPPILSTDDQLAAVLGMAIADVLQKQELRAQPTKHLMTATTIVGDAAGAVIPGLSVAALVSNHNVKARLDRRLLEQSSRETLFLMHDAGFNLNAAPIALWKLPQKKGQPLEATPLTESVRYMYSLLGTVWEPEASESQAANGSPHLATRDAASQ